MTRRHEIEAHLRSLEDIRAIIGAMKSLSVMESRKLARFLSSQQRVLESIRRAAGDFLRAYPRFAAPGEAARSVLVLIGAERGFCGDFNDRLVQALDDQLARTPAPDAKLILVGSKLAGALENHPLLAATVEGATVGTEVDAVISRLTDRLSVLDKQSGPATVTVLHHDHDLGAIRVTPVLPPFLGLDGAGAFSFPPLLNLSPEAFYPQLVDHYLFAALFEMFFTSLMAEHARRIQHLEAALGRLDERTAALGKRRNHLRQEEITEEIEVILLSSGALERY